MIFSCSECEKEFHNKSNFNRHMSKFHKKVADNGGLENEVKHFENIYEKYKFDHNEETSDEEASNENASDESSMDEDTEEVIDVWKIIADEALENYNGDFSEAYKTEVEFSKDLRNDVIHRKIMRTLKKFQEEDDMEFDEALNCAIEKRKFLIKKAALSALKKTDDREEEL